MQRFYFYNAYDQLAHHGKGVCKTLSTDDTADVQSFLDNHQGYYIFFLTAYEAMHHFSVQNNGLDTAKWSLVIPQYVHVKKSDENNFYLQNESGLHPIESEDYDSITENIHSVKAQIGKWKIGVSQEEYYKNFETIQDCLQRGDIYEVNYCIPFESNAEIQTPYTLFNAMQNKIAAPFAGYFDNNDQVLMSYSPERFVRKVGDTVYSQPIKGTAPRFENKKQDEASKNALSSSQKERAENVMIVDLVRNDLSKIAKKNSVQVDELCGIYSFTTVHQMISTVSCKVDRAVDLIDVFKAAYPMGSMTGAPKISAMKIIDQVENFKRGWYSGSLGIVLPNGDFDSNVVIRSLLYDRKKRKLYGAAGGAITIQADAQNEYRECMLKFEGIKNTLSQNCD